MKNPLISTIFLLASCSLIQASPQPHVLTYGHDREVPMPFLIGGSDLAFVDWDGNGLKDILVSPNGEKLILRRNIGSPEKPLFANVYEEETAVIEDKRVGRFFSLMKNSGITTPDTHRPAIISFEKHAGIAEINVRPLPLNLFVAKNNDAKTEWEVIPALWPDGTRIEAFPDAWMCPDVTVVDWDNDGKDDLLVGVWHSAIAQPGGKYTAGYNHPQDSWNPYAGRLYIMRNVSSDNQLKFDKPVPVETDDSPIKTYGFIYPQTIDIDGDGLFDLVIGEQRPGLRWYRNTGTKQKPAFTFAGMLADPCGKAIESVLSLRAYFEDLDDDGNKEMITTSYFAFSMGLNRFDQAEPGTTDLSRNWKYSGMLPMRGSKNTPLTAQGICTVEVTDWNGDGIRDLLIGAEPGTPMIVINSGTNANPEWEVPQRLRFVNGDPLEYYGIDIGRGSVWGPIEFYMERTLPRLADWNGDGTEDIITGSMAARLIRLPGQRVDGELRFAQPQVFTLNDKPLEVAHRVQPVVLDINSDGFADIVALDTHNVVTVWYGDGSSALHNPQHFEGPDAQPLQLNPSEMTVISGRRGLALFDWDLDGVLDLITYNAFGPRVWGGEVRLHLGDRDHPFRFQEPVALFDIISHHNGGIYIVDWNEDGYPDILIGGDHHHLEAGSEPRGQFFVLWGRDMPVPPAPR